MRHSLPIALLVAAAFLAEGCSAPSPLEGSKESSSAVNGPGETGATGEACAFDCSAWDVETFGAGSVGRAPRLFSTILSSGTTRVVAEGFVGSEGTCIPKLPPGTFSSAFSTIRFVPPSTPTSATEDVLSGSEPDDQEIARGQIRYACMANGVFAPASGAAPAPQEDLASYVEGLCVADGACTSVTPETPTETEQTEIPEGSEEAQKFVQQLVRDEIAAASRKGSLRIRDFNPNDHVPVGGFFGRRLVAHITEGPCRAFNGIDAVVQNIGGRWGVSASYGVNANAPGVGVQAAGMFAYDLTEYESAAYYDVSVNLGLVLPSIGASVSRALTVGLAESNTYGSIHGLMGGEYMGLNGSGGLPFVPLGVGASLSRSTPIDQLSSPVTIAMNLSVSLSPAAMPNYSAGVALGTIRPFNVMTRSLRGITGGLVNVFDDEYLAEAAGHRMRNSPGNSDLWRAGSFANSMVRFAYAHDLAAFAIARVAFERVWASIRRVCN